MMSKNFLSVALFMFIRIVLMVTSDKNLSQLASAHFARILRDAKCNLPVPRMVYMSDLNPPPNKKYLPYGTLLHVCGPEVGCCPHESDICVPKSVEKVELYFWVLELTPHGSKKSVESFMFNNHTHCECRHRSISISDNTTYNSTVISAADDSHEDNKGSNSYLFVVIILFVILSAIAAIIGLAVFVRRIRKSPENSENDIDYDATDNNNNNAVTEEAAAKAAKPTENKLTNTDKNKLKKNQQTGYYMDNPRKQNTQKTQMTQRTGYSLGVRPKKADNNQFREFDTEIVLKINDMIDEEYDDLVGDDDGSNVKRKPTEPLLFIATNLLPK